MSVKKKNTDCIEVCSRKQHKQFNDYHASFFIISNSIDKNSSQAILFLACIDTIHKHQHKFKTIKQTKLNYRIGRLNVFNDALIVFVIHSCSYTQNQRNAITHLGKMEWRWKPVFGNFAKSCRQKTKGNIW